MKLFALLNYILDNNILVLCGDNVKCASPPTILILSEREILNLHFFYWLINRFYCCRRFFRYKNKWYRFYSIKQKGIENYNIIKAICKLITEKDARPIKADTADCYQLTLSANLAVKKLVVFFSSPENSLFGYKLLQYNIWLKTLKASKRYKEIKFHA